MTTASWSGITSANWCIFSDTPRVAGCPSSVVRGNRRYLAAETDQKRGKQFLQVTALFQVTVSWLPQVAQSSSSSQSEPA